MDYLDKLSLLRPVPRKTYMDKPTHLEEWEYYYSPYYGISGLLLHNYEESDESLRKRIMEIAG